MVSVQLDDVYLELFVPPPLVPLKNAICFPSFPSP